MAFELNDIVPWGRSFDEYVRIFDLTEDELALTILGCADGPSSFNRKITKRGGKAISCDPIYEFNTEQLRERIEGTYDKVMEQTYKNERNFVWDYIKSPDELGKIRMEVMSEFIADFKTGKQQGRYLAESLPKLPFGNRHFDLALCSHFLFLYTKQLSLEFHLTSIMEMCRVAKEVRIFPLLDLDAKKSGHLPAICSELRAAGLNVEIRKVPYEFQHRGNEMMRIIC